MASTDARAFPTKNTAYRVTFPILDADGDLVTGATGLDSEISKDGGTFADCTNEATEIATSSGMYYLDLTSTEMNADTVAIIVKTSSSGAKTTPMVFYPATLSVAQLGVNAVQLGGTAQTGRDIGASVLLSSGTGTGQLDITSGVVKANLAQILGTALTETAGQIAAAFKQFFDVASPTGTMKAITSVGTVTTLTNLPAITSNWLTAAGIAASAFNGKGDWNVGKTGYSLTATTGLGDQTANLTGNLSGSVGSVTAGVTVTTNNDKTGYGLSSAAVQAVWDALTSALTTVGSIGKKLADWTIGTAQTGDSFARLGAPVGASISADIAGVQSDTNDIQTRIPAALVSGRIDASVGAMAAGVVTAAAVATGAIDADALATDAVTEIWAGSTAPTAAAIADAVLDEDMTAHQTQGTLGQAIGDPAADTDTIWGLVNTNLNATVSSRASQTSVDTIDDLLDTEVAAILADTNELKTDLVNGGRLDLLIDGIKAKTDLIPASPASVGDIPTAAAIADAVLDEDMTAHQTQGTLGQAIGDPVADSDTIWALVNTNLNATVSSRASQTSVDTVDDFLDTEIAAIKAKTDNLPADPADQSAVEAAITAATTGLATAAALSTVAGYVDTEVAAIKAKTDLIPASPAATGDIPSAGTIADAVWDEATVEVSQGIPPATPTFRQAVMYLYMALRNRMDVVATFKKFYNDAGAVIWKKALADDGTTYTESEGETGP